MQKIILASTSPRRKELLSQLGLQFECFSPEVDETPIGGESPLKMVLRLAHLKAQAVFLEQDLPKNIIVIAADTTVVSPRGKNLGKPQNANEARSMLRLLAGKTHTVLTAYCLMGTKRNQRVSHLGYTRSRVKMRSVSAHWIKNYVATEEPMDKAGSYAAQGIGMSLIESISGSYTGVVGLPICQVTRDLEKKFGVVLWK